MRNSRYSRHSRLRESMGVLGVVIFAVGYVVGVKTNARGDQQLPGRVARLAGRVRPLRNAPSSQTIDLREVREVMSPALATVRPTDTVQKAARLMRTSEIGDVIVETKKGRLLGIVTDRDLAIRAAAKGMDPTSTKVREVFTPEVAITLPRDSVHEAIGLMRAKNIRRLPVVESGKAIGIVWLGDISTETDPYSPTSASRRWTSSAGVRRGRHAILR